MSRTPWHRTGPRAESITRARTGLSEDLRGRQRRYIVAMLVRSACVVLMAVTWNSWPAFARFPPGVPAASSSRTHTACPADAPAVRAPARGRVSALHLPRRPAPYLRDPPGGPCSSRPATRNQSSRSDVQVRGSAWNAVPDRDMTAQADGWMRVRTAWMQGTTR
ncbi:DUF3099 domain-containing protein [Streptomyces sp. NPDC058295]|uniref:DUF3099 domain-containing protein n=1 Tax=Streptomyces sp. NPDC058295 TaxID=3346431 RepID=UPI0036E745E2